MFYKMIEAKRNEWLASDACTIKNDIAYIEKTGQMRDAQVEAIKTYLFLKIACDCRPLADLFYHGTFNTLSLEEIEVSSKVRDHLASNPAAAALFEYSRLTNDAGEQVSIKLEQQIRKDPNSIDYLKFFQNAFYGLSYTDYLFSLPMGAGKTFLMAAFIYLDLYFAKNEPHTGIQKGTVGGRQSPKSIPVTAALKSPAVWGFLFIMFHKNSNKTAEKTETATVISALIPK